MKTILNQLTSDYPDIKFIEGKRFKWSPGARTINYKNGTSQVFIWKIFHELGHAQLNHNNYKSDIELLKIETAAWEKAKYIANKYNKIIAEDFIQDCLDTYRDWLHKRSCCPKCGKASFQKTLQHYQCFNCLSNWLVTNNPLCRPYRRSIINHNEAPRPYDRGIYANNKLNI